MRGLGEESRCAEGLPEDGGSVQWDLGSGGVRVAAGGALELSRVTHVAVQLLFRDYVLA